MFIPLRERIIITNHSAQYDTIIVTNIGRFDLIIY
jgi:hypothetical protein